MKLQVEQKLVSKKINPTAMRILVLEVLLQQSSALSLSDIEKNLETADRITIYRTLKTFEQNGLIHSIEDGTGTPKYALCMEDCSTMSIMTCMSIFTVTPARRLFVCPIIKSLIFPYHLVFRLPK